MTQTSEPTKILKLKNTSVQYKMSKLFSLLKKKYMEQGIT